MTEALFHERALLGAIDSYLGNLVHVRPYLVKRFEQVLEEMAEQWLEEGGLNEVAAIEDVWLAAYVRQSKERSLTQQVIRDFYRWAKKNGLLEQTPYDF